MCMCYVGISSNYDIRNRVVTRNIEERNTYASFVVSVLCVCRTK